MAWVHAQRHQVTLGPKVDVPHPHLYTTDVVPIASDQMVRVGRSRRLKRDFDETFHYSTFEGNKIIVHGATPEHWLGPLRLQSIEVRVFRPPRAVQSGNYSVAVTEKAEERVRAIGTPDVSVQFTIGYFVVQEPTDEPGCVAQLFGDFRFGPSGTRTIRSPTRRGS